MDAAEQRRIDAGNDIDLKWLRSFVVVAEEASFTRAASRVHVAQPGVSAQVRRPPPRPIPPPGPSTSRRERSDHSGGQCP